MNELVQISSIDAFIELARKFPALTNLNAVASLKNLITTQQPKKGCNCSGRAKQATNELNNYRAMFEAGMVMLSPEEKELFKSILNTKKVCYFVKDNKGQIKKYCF